MRYDSGQFGSFCGADNRRTIFECFERMGRNLTDEQAGARRAGFLTGLQYLILGGLAGRPIVIEGRPTPGEAYKLFVAITGCLGVEINAAAALLEEAVRHLEAQDYAAPLAANWALEPAP